MTRPTDRPTGLSRRTFLATAAGALGLAACGDDPLAPTDAAAPFDGALFDTATPDAPPADTAPPEDTAPADTAPPADTADASPPVERVDPSATLEDATLFPLGVQSGDPLPDGAVLWTRFTASRPLELLVFTPDGDDPFGPGPLAQRAVVRPADGGFVHADLRGLLPGHAYAFAFIDGFRRSRVGRFRTAPAPTASPVVVFGAGTCSKYVYRPFDVLSRAAEHDLAFFLLGGDTVYADGAVTAADYREKWAENLGTDGYQAMLRVTPTIATWDDHEVDNNWDVESYPAEHIATARAALFEHLAIRRDPAHPDRIWRSLRYGRTLEVFVLDARGEKRPSTRKTGQPEYLSPTQLSWLEAALSASTATFKVILNSLPITNMPLVWLNADERWEGYDLQREEILAHTATIPGVLWVSGDFHYGAIQHVDRPEDPYFDQIEVLVGPMAQVNPATGALMAIADPAQFEWISSEYNYTRFRCDPAASPPTIVVEHIDGQGAVLHSRAITF